MFSSADRVALQERASTLWERIEGRFAPVEPGANASRRLRRWADIVAAGDVAVLERRLSWDGLSLEEVRAALEGARFEKPPAIAPRWLTALEEAGPFLSHRASSPFVDPRAPVPFEDALVGLVLYAKEKLDASTSAYRRRLSEAARRCLERSLLQLLSRVCGSTLQRRFGLYRSRRGSLLGLFSGAEASREDYTSYVERLREDGGLPAIFVDYPFLARLSGGLLTSWIDAHREMLERLEKDEKFLERELGIELGGGAILSLQPYESDLHEDGRSVVRLDFENGRSLFYKPRNLELERRFCELLRWLDEGETPLFAKLRVASREGYGFMESAREATGRDLHRAGALLAVLYLLDGMDAHVENVVFTDDGPVLVDAEALFHPRLSEASAKALAPERARLIAEETVLRTELLPTERLFGGAHSFEYAGLSASSSMETPFTKEEWARVNTDGMTLGWRRFTMPRGSALPRDPAGPIAAGFECAYRRLMRRNLRGALDAFEGVRSRLVLRPSGVYGALFQRLLSPSVLRDGADWSVEVEALARPFLRSSAKPPLWPALEEERRAIDRLDTPRFEARTDALAPSWRDGLPCFGRSALDAVRERAESLSEKDLERQTDAIHAAFAPDERARERKRKA